MVCVYSQLCGIVRLSTDTYLYMDIVVEGINSIYNVTCTVFIMYILYINRQYDFTYLTETFSHSQGCCTVCVCSIVHYTVVGLRWNISRIPLKFYLYIL